MANGREERKDEIDVCRYHARNLIQLARFATFKQTLGSAEDLAEEDKRYYRKNLRGEQAVEFGKELDTVIALTREIKGESNDPLLKEISGMDPDRRV